MNLRACYKPSKNLGEIETSSDSDSNCQDCNHRSMPGMLRFDQTKTKFKKPIYKSDVSWVASWVLNLPWRVHHHQAGQVAECERREHVDSPVHVIVFDKSWNNSIWRSSFRIAVVAYSIEGEYKNESKQNRNWNPFGTRLTEMNTIFCKIDFKIMS